jgi:hypothetical protein
VPDILSHIPSRQRVTIHYSIHLNLTSIADLNRLARVRNFRRLFFVLLYATHTSPSLPLLSSSLPHVPFRNIQPPPPPQRSHFFCIASTLRF